MMKPTSNSQRYVVIRPFVKGDEVECKRIIQQMCMSMVNRTFLAALFRETTFQLMVFFAAILFIIVGVPFGYCAVSAPLTITFLYVLVWSNAMMKSMELQNEVALMKQQYQQSDKTECFVAEYYGPLLDLDSKAPIVFTNPHDIQGFEAELSSKKRKIVGFLGLVRNKDKACSSWLRRLVVEQEFRRRSIATELLSRAAHFCYEKGYSSIEVCVNECQYEGKEFLLKQEFELEQLYHKTVLGSTAVYTKYLFRKNLTHTRSALNA